MYKLAHLSMRTRALLLGLVPSILMFILLVSLFFWQRMSDVETEVEAVGNILTSQLVASIEYPVISGNYELLKPLVASAMAAPSVVKVSIEDTNGTVLYQKMIEGYEEFDPKSIQVYSRPLIHEQVVFDDFSDFGGISSSPKVSSEIAYVKLSLSHLLGRDRAFFIAAKSMGWASIILLVCMLLAHKMAKSIAKPIEQVSLSLSRIADGELDGEIDVTSGAEIGELQRGVNAMAKALKQSGDKQLQAINDLELARKRAEDANKAKSEFLAIVSHELRTPISGAMGALQLLQYQTDEKNHQYYNIADRSLNNLLELVEDMLTLGSLGNKEQTLEQIVLNIPTIIEHTLSDLREKALQNENQLMVYLDEVVINKMVNLDGIKFRQLVRHLLGNAIKFTRNGNIYCSIYIDNTTEKEVLKLDVSDNGVGFPDEFKSSMFEAFKQQDSSLTRTFEGLGIGLTICHDIIQLMQGRIEIRDNSPKGTIINCSIPITVIDDDREAKLEKERDRAQKVMARVLVVEDNQVNRMVAEKILLNMHLDPVTVESGKQCIEQYRAEKYDLIFMDCQMPGMDGFETTRAIRAFEKLSNKAPVPIIALTANTSSNVREDCKQAGMSDYIAKPIKIEVLSDIINKWLI